MGVLVSKGNLLELDCTFAYQRGFRLQAQLALPPGVTAICGPSGSGKTTLLSLIAGLLRPEAGTIRLHGATLFSRQPPLWVPPERRRIGILFQEDRLFPHMDVRTNVTFGQRQTPGGKTDRGQWRQWTEWLEIDTLLDRMPGSLSGGQRQRVALARAIVTQPRLLLLDEPLTAVEAPLRERIMRALTDQLQAEAVPTILVSHQAGFVRQFADRALTMENGRLPAVETAKKLASSLPDELT